MDTNEMATISDSENRIDEAIRKFYETIERTIQPLELDLTIIENQKKLIDSFAARTDIDEATKLLFLQSYKRMIKEYHNCSNVVHFAAPHVEDTAKPEEIEEDWLAYFFDKVRLVSNEAIQNMWAHILAGEANTPGRFSRSLLHTLSVMSSSQAELFCNISRFCMYGYKKEDIVHPFIFISKNVEAYKNSRITADGLFGLENLGLIQCDFKDEFVFQNKKVLRYGNKVLEIHGDPENDNKICAGNVRFTDNGLALFEIVGSSYKSYRTDILDFIITKLQRRNCKILINNRVVE